MLSYRILFESRRVPRICSVPAMTYPRLSTGTFDFRLFLLLDVPYMFEEYSAYEAGTPQADETE
jgi:hypothetical protein